MKNNCTFQFSHMALWAFTIVCFAFIVNSGFAIASEGAYGDRICDGRRLGLVNCRPPTSVNDFKMIEQSNSRARYASCKFSLTSSWVGEIRKINNQIAAEIEFQKFIKKNIFWAQQDINKQQFLPSETVRAAYDNIDLYAPMLTESNFKITTYRWCNECANKKQNGGECN